jgi:calcium binding protein 39
MAFLFGGRSKKSPQDLLKSLAEGLEALVPVSSDAKDDKAKKVDEKISSSLSAMKFILYGDGETEPKREDVDKLCQGLLADRLLLQVLQNMKHFEFEARKDAAQICSFLLRQKQQEAVEYVERNQEILQLLVKGYEDQEVALNTGSILRECIRHQQLCERVLMTATLFEPFFEYVQLATFDVASDAFATFKLLLTKHKQMCAKFLEQNFDRVFAKYNVLLESKNYVTKRQSLKLLGELLLDRSNFKVMMLYISSTENLRIMMNLLRGQTKAIQFEAFHVFKIFVANPRKTKPIIEILLRNKDKLIEFLKKFQTDKEDEQFNEEKRILLNSLTKLDQAALDRAEEGKQPPAAAAPAAAAAAAPAPGSPPQAVSAAASGSPRS